MSSRLPLGAGRELENVTFHRHFLWKQILSADCFWCVHSLYLKCPSPICQSGQEWPQWGFSWCPQGRVSVSPLCYPKPGPWYIYVLLQLWYRVIQNHLYFRCPFRLETAYGQSHIPYTPGSLHLPWHLAQVSKMLNEQLSTLLSARRIAVLMGLWKGSTRAHQVWSIG